MRAVTNPLLVMNLLRYVLSHWRGEQGLVKSVLLNGVAFYLIFALPLGSVGSMINGKAVIFAGVAAFAMWLVWASVGVLRCGTRYLCDRTKGASSRIGGAAAIFGVLAVAWFTAKDLIHLSGLAR